jgi:hypothetical protein
MTKRSEISGTAEQDANDGTGITAAERALPEPEVAPPAPADPTPPPPVDPFDRAMEILRAPFPETQIGRLPRAVKKDDNERFRCEEANGRQVSADGYFCGGYHVRSVHLSYVGHAALTARLLDADPRWNWEPVAVDQYGLPAIVNGGLWIRLTIAGVTRLGYGDAPGKRDATKELIGDALRNGAMRFGAALDLWSKEDLRAETVEPTDEPAQRPSAGSGSGAASGRPAGGQQGAQQGGAVVVDEEKRSAWRLRVLSTEYLGAKPKEKRDGGLRTAYADATREGVLSWAVVPGQDETFVQLFGRLSKSLPEWPDESKDTVPPDEDEAARVERLAAEAEREAQDRPMALGGGADDPWATSGADEAGWGNTGAGA